MAQLAEDAAPIDVVTVSEALQNLGQLEETGGLSYLAELAKNTPSAANIKAYASIVRERSVLRQLIGVGNDIADSGFTPDGRATQELLDNAERRVFEIAEQSARKGGPESIKPLLAKAIDRIDELLHRRPANGPFHRFYRSRRRDLRPAKRRSGYCGGTAFHG